MHYSDHALLSVRKFGGQPEDYIQLHKLMDSSKHHFPNFMHRMFSHNTWFVSVVDELMGPTIKNSDGWDIPVRDILHEHMREDHNGHCPTILEWTENIDLKGKTASWINRPDPKELHYLKNLKMQTDEQTADSLPG
jgi:hypothetical protein